MALKTKRGEAWRANKVKHVFRLITPLQRKIAEQFPKLDVIIKHGRLTAYSRGGTEPLVICKQNGAGDWVCGEHRFENVTHAVSFANAVVQKRARQSETESH